MKKSVGHRRRLSKLAVEGGDFDAAKEGAAREAELILEEKGMHHHGYGSRHHSLESTGSNQDAGNTESVSSDTAGDKDKVGLKDKIKAKLHLHSSAHS
ncbi:hypothetical protein VTJ49DRAFT_3144 [Mycothermus thermophilus]|uniref:Uncharacterized protein n=1 Tax=Humicola insolens TaxID=85995 RepID=A0ABR3V9G2_HUMIN